MIYFIFFTCLLTPYLLTSLGWSNHIGRFATANSRGSQNSQISHVQISYRTSNRSKCQMWKVKIIAKVWGLFATNCYFWYYYLLETFQREEEINKNPLSKPEGAVEQTSAEILYGAMLPSLPQVKFNKHWSGLSRFKHETSLWFVE